MCLVLRVTTTQLSFSDSCSKRKHITSLYGVNLDAFGSDYEHEVSSMHVIDCDIMRFAELLLF